MELPSKFSELQPAFDRLCLMLENTYNLGVVRSSFSGKESFLSSFAYYEIDLCSSSIAVSNGKLVFSLSTKYSDAGVANFDEIRLEYHSSDDLDIFIEDCHNVLAKNIETLERLHILGNLNKTLQGVCDKLSETFDLKSVYMYHDDGFTFGFDLCTSLICCFVSIDGTFTVKSYKSRDNKRLPLISFDFSQSHENDCIELIVMQDKFLEGTGALYLKLENILSKEVDMVKGKFRSAVDQISKSIKGGDLSMSLSISYHEWLATIRCRNIQLIYDGFSVTWCEIIPTPKILCECNDFGKVNSEDLKMVGDLFNA